MMSDCVFVWIKMIFLLERQLVSPGGDMEIEQPLTGCDADNSCNLGNGSQGYPPGPGSSGTFGLNRERSGRRGVRRDNIVFFVEHF
jgi:hypothetical protein